MPNPQIQSLNDRADFCRERIEQCEEIIKQLRGDLPEGCMMAFSIREIPIVKFDVADAESWFLLSFFMGWHKNYTNELKAITLALQKEVV